jgi:hypothetical protein
MLQKPAGSEGLRIVRVEGYWALYPLFAFLNLLSLEPQRISRSFQQPASLIRCPYFVFE